jgi:hypothetical protein
MIGRRCTWIVLCAGLFCVLIAFAVLKIFSLHVERAVLEAVADYTQHHITLEGKFIFKPRLSPKIVIKHITLNGKNKEKNHFSLPFLETGKIVLTPTWRSLLSDTPELRAVNAKNVSFNIVDTGQGHPIWNMLLDKTSQEFSADDRKVLQGIHTIRLDTIYFNYMDQYGQFHRYQFDTVVLKHHRHQWEFSIKGQYLEKPLFIQGTGVFDKVKGEWTVNAAMNVLKNQINLRGVMVPNFQNPQFIGEVDAQGKELSAFLSLIHYQMNASGAYQLHSKLRMNDKFYQLSQLDLQFAKTTLKGDMDLPRGHSHQALRAKVQINTKNAGRFLTLFGISDSFSQGSLWAAADIRSSVTSKKAFVNHLSGIVGLDIKNLLYKGIHSLATQPKGEAFYRAASTGTRSRDMLLHCFMGQFRIKQGVGQTEGFVLKTPAMLVLGKGSIDLRDQRLNLALKPQSAGVIIPGIPTGIRMGGTLSQPRITATLSKGGIIPVIFGVATGGVGLAAFAGLDILTSAGSGSNARNECSDYIAHVQ